MFSQKHLKLSVCLLHEFGSGKLVEYTSSLGYCASYSELHRFLMLAAVKQTQTTTSVRLVSHQTKENDEIHDVGNNWDHNARTVNGKRMAGGADRKSVSSGVFDPILKAEPNNLDTMYATQIQGNCSCHETDINSSLHILIWIF